MNSTEDIVETLRQIGLEQEARAERDGAMDSYDIGYALSELRD